LLLALSLVLSPSSQKFVRLSHLSYMCTFLLEVSRANFLQKDVHYVMKKLLLFLAALGVLVLSACSRQVPELAQAPQDFSRVLSVQVDNTAERSAVEAQYGGKVIAWYPENGVAILGFYGGDLGAQSVDAFKTPEVSTLSAYNNGFRAWGGGNRAWGGGYRAWGGGGTTYPTTFTENQTVWSQIRLTQGQNLTPNLGRGIKIAVIDSGIDLAHPAFVGKLAPSSEWKDFVGNDSNPQEVSGGNGYGHGTAVAGVILQVAPQTTILPIRVLEPDGSGDLDDVVLAVDWAIAKGVKVINLSLGTEVDYKALKDILKVATSRGIVVVASAGNNGKKGLEYPARYSAECFGVGSVQTSDAKSVFTAYGSGLDTLAPGEYIYSAYPGQQVAYSSGTSFAAPIVSGAYALALGEKALAKNALEQALKNASENVKNKPGNEGLLPIDLSGRINVEAFLRSALSK
jgi:thermitase